ncbi:hypothetical protein SDJN02_16153, partial [Cucurbita argyrosperma subsp. argyrosperma]
MLIPSIYFLKLNIMMMPSIDSKEFSFSILSLEVVRHILATQSFEKRAIDFRSQIEINNAHNLDEPKKIRDEY